MSDEYEYIWAVEVSDRLKEQDVEKAIAIAYQYGGIDGDHHKAWVIDQMVRALTGLYYTKFVAEAEANGEEWNVGIAP